MIGLIPGTTSPSGPSRRRLRREEYEDRHICSSYSWRSRPSNYSFRTLGLLTLGVALHLYFLINLVQEKKGFKISTKHESEPHADRQENFLSKPPILSPSINVDQTVGIDDRAAHKEEKISIDFVIAGFAKCGTTTIMRTTKRIPQLFVGKPARGENEDGQLRVREDKLLAQGKINEFMNQYGNRTMEERYYKGKRVLNGFKSPGVLLSQSYMSTIVKNFPQLDMVISVRHPVLHFQSEYNYFYGRDDANVVRSEQGMLIRNVPDPLHMIGNCGIDCRGDCIKARFCSRHSYFHYWLSRLDLTAPMNSTEEVNLLGHHSLSIHPGWKGRLFLIDIGQIADKDVERKELLTRSFEDFLGIEKHAVNASSSWKHRRGENHKKLIDICDTRYFRLRNKLVTIGGEAATWIREYLLKSDRVVVPNRDHFLDLIEKWGTDPCVKSMHTLEYQDPNVGESKKSWSQLEHFDKSVTTFIPPDVNISFAIAGFAKCGSSTMMITTNAVPRIFMGNPNGTEVSEVHDLRRNEIHEFRDRYKQGGTKSLNGFKSPEILQSEAFLTNLIKYFPHINLVVSTRHPVWHFQSRYNFKFRRTKLDKASLPSPLSLIGNCGRECRRNCTIVIDRSVVCTQLSYFHYGLSRLFLTSLRSEEERNLLDHHDLSVHPEWKGKLFLMELGQIADDDFKRRGMFERSYEQFLGIERQSYNSTRDEKSNHANEETYEKFINICDEKHAAVRRTLVTMGGKAATWIREYLMKSDRVQVPNEKHFLELIGEWGHDPCLGRN